MVQAFTKIEEDATDTDTATMRPQKDQAAIKAAKAAYQEAYNKKMATVTQRVYAQHQKRVAEKEDAPTPNRGNPRPKTTNYMPEM